ncbi:MAG TPA: YdeI/OmpD-associated family protein [Actinomycetota bacterium]|nr:YdeI/OmpD-associated family protein [Actinomycetota bacterium]
MPDPIFFSSPQDFRKWLAKNHAKEKELWVGYYKKATGIPSLTWSEAVDQALCYGWIDGVLKRIDDTSHMQRFTPRTKTSNWSERNIGRVAELTAKGLMRAAGKKAFAARTPVRSGTYSYEQRYEAKLDPAQEKEFRKHKKAWKFFQSRPPSYRATAIWWVVSAKRDETKLRRLARLIDDSEAERTVPPLTQ